MHVDNDMTLVYMGGGPGICFESDEFFSTVKHESCYGPYTTISSIKSLKEKT